MSTYQPEGNPGTEALAAVFDEWCDELPPEERKTAQILVEYLVKSPIRNFGEKSAKELIVITLTHPTVRKALKAAHDG